MSKKNNILRAAVAALCMISMLFISSYNLKEVYAASGYEFVILGTYSKSLRIGETFYLPVITSTGKKPSFSSSNSRVASVNTYGKITAKKAGQAVVTAKIKNGEACCRVVVQKTSIQLNQREVFLENGQSMRLKASVSTGHAVVWKSSKKSIATINNNGEIVARKPGKTIVTASADGTVISCAVTVKRPVVQISSTVLSLYRKEVKKLSATSTSNSVPLWKSNRKSIAVVDSNGYVRGIKHGTAMITVTVDGVSKSCEVTVKKPAISFESNELFLSKGQKVQLNVHVSSGNKPQYRSSNTNVVSVDNSGSILAKQPGKAYIYASEDGTRERITVRVVNN